MASDRIIGIDLGTTNSCVAVMDGDEVRVLPNAEGARTTPSVIAFTEDGGRLVGQLAKRQAVTNPKKTIYAAKRLIGRKYDDPEIAAVRQLLPYDLVAAPNGDAHIKVGDRHYSPAEMGAAVLTKMKEAAEAFIGDTVTRAVITVPAYFDDAQRQATRDAGRIAGLEVERIINEPTAATLAYGLADITRGTRTVAVYDLGGGTFDISILELRDGAFEVLATAGDTMLGGEDFDHAILDWMADEVQSRESVDLRKDPLARQRLKDAAEKAKHELSWSLETQVNLPFIGVKAGVPFHVELELSRRRLDQLTAHLVDKTLAPCKLALSDAKISIGDIDEVLLVGGQTRMPLVIDRVSSFFGRTPNKGVNPDEVVAAGAAIQGGILAGVVKDIVLLDVVPLNIGVETAGGVFTSLIPKGTTIPTKRSEVFSTSVDNQPMVPVHVLQGLREMAADCRSLARLQLTDIPPAPRGVPEIRVTFDIDANGILSVSAQDLATSRSATMRVQPASGLSEAALQTLIEEAESSKQVDVGRKEDADLRNRSETLLYTCRRSMEAYGSFLSETDREDVTGDVVALEAALARSAPAWEVRELLARLESSSHQIYEAMMASTQGPEGQGAG